MKRLLCRLGTVFLLGCCAVGAAVPPEKELTVMNYNIWYTFDETKYFDQGGKFLREQNPDVLALEEICYADEVKFKDWAKSWGYDYAEMLKPGTMSIGICAKQPIEVLTKQVDDMHHGFLLCRIDGVYFLVTHLSPFLYEKRRTETKLIADALRPLLEKGEKIIVLGDFNTPPVADAAVVNAKELLLAQNRELDEKYDYVTNLENGKFEFEAIRTLMNLPLKDIAWELAPEQLCDTYPTNRGVASPDEKKGVGYRIDLILVSENLVPHCRSFEVIENETTNLLSDHYPVKLTIRF